MAYLSTFNHYLNFQNILMIKKKLDNQGLSNRFKTDELILVSAPIFLILIAIAVVLVAPHIIRYWEVDRCLDASGAYDYEKDECVVTRKESSALPAK